MCQRSAAVTSCICSAGRSDRASPPDRLRRLEDGHLHLRPCRALSRRVADHRTVPRSPPCDAAGSDSACVCARSPSLPAVPAARASRAAAGRAHADSGSGSACDAARSRTIRPARVNRQPIPMIAVPATGPNLTTLFRPTTNPCIAPSESESPRCRLSEVRRMMPLRFREMPLSAF